jgi:serine phosphatase RsbU (regulator of sigma subunit)
VRDLIHDRAEKQRLAAELAASRAVQQILIPEQTPEIPGFTIDAVYEPYGEVGGDFYQILPLVDGGALIAIGDVSGKGMPAAMMVSLLAGTLHALVETTTSPGQLLAGLNRLVQGRSHGGFTTCLILRIAPDGAVTFANAGHISPYLLGKELVCENGLPLGLVAAGSYPESSFDLRAREQLTLLTDGVVEARNGAGELFGFDRTAANASLTAEAIAQQAQAFGQDDDITVLTVARMATA